MLLLLPTKFNIQGLPMARRLTANRRIVDDRSDAFGWLRDSSQEAVDSVDLRRRLENDGYLYLRNLVEKEILAQIRELAIDELRRNGLLDPQSSTDGEVRARRGVDFYGVLEALNGHEAIRQVARLPSLLTLFSNLFGEPARGLDFVWPRAAGPGRGEMPHCDWVYMSRGTPRLLTVWIPLAEVPVEHGSLMLLENSHRANPFTKKYLGLDADRLGFFRGVRFKHGHFINGGRYSVRPDKVRAEFGTRWLTENFKVGDAVIFGPKMLHATLDNQTKSFRLSLDTRFQPASEPVDPRFVGATPEAHSKQDKSIFDYYTRLKRLLTGRDTAAPTGIALTYARIKQFLVGKDSTENGAPESEKVRTGL